MAGRNAWNEIQPLVEENDTPMSTEVMEKQEDYDVGFLYKAICNNKWDAAKAFIDQHYPSALKAILNWQGQTALHVAAEYGQEAIVEELVILMPPHSQYLEIVDHNGCTPLAYVATFGEHMTRLAECMVKKNKNILGIPAPGKLLPVTLAVSSGHKEMGRYLYSVTPLECLKPEKAIQGPALLHKLFTAGELDLALDLLQRCEELLFASDDNGWNPIQGIANMRYAFLSGNKLVFWKRWIYHWSGVLHRLISYTFEFLGIKEIYKTKWLHVQATQILRLICNNVTAIDRNQKEIVAKALFRAAAEGLVEFVAEVTNANPSTVLFTDNSLRHLFFYAVQYRQAEVFNLIQGNRFKSTLTTRVDSNGNTMLHVAGMLASSSELNRISGSALQMQSELQWFKELESVVPPGYKVQSNYDFKMAEDIFKESHKELRKDGENWMRQTASSCSVVGALVITIMYTAAFTLPGGNNQNSGYPIFLDKDNKLFIVFIISDALSMFSSTTSVLMCLGILTSRYTEEDFLNSLPTKLIIGLSTLFLSIATMIIAFSTTILIMLQHRPQSWTFPSVIMLASVPVTLFVVLQFPLLVQMISSTYGPGIFKRNVKP